MICTMVSFLFFGVVISVMISSAAPTVPKKYPVYYEKAVQPPKVVSGSWPLPIFQNYWNDGQDQTLQMQYETELERYQLSQSYPKVYTNQRSEKEKEEDEDEEKVNETTTKKPNAPPVGGFSLLFGGKPVDPDAPEEEDDPNPFDFEETSLTLIPSAKYKVQHFPDWCGANVQFTYPITFRFEDLDWPEGPPFPFGRRFFHAPLFHKSHYEKKWSRHKRSVMELPPMNAIRGGERAYLIPKVEKLLKSRFGVRNGKACLLKTICEIHENRVHENYGFLGEMLNLIFSVSRSSFSSTHLPSYLKAEENGRSGNCLDYIDKCPYSLFEAVSTDTRKDEQCDLDSQECDLA